MSDPVLDPLALWFGNLPHALPRRLMLAEVHAAGVKGVIDARMQSHNATTGRETSAVVRFATTDDAAMCWRLNNRYPTLWQGCKPLIVKPAYVWGPLLQLPHNDHHGAAVTAAMDLPPASTPCSSAAAAPAREVVGAVAPAAAASAAANAVSSAVATSGTAVAFQSCDDAVARAAWVPPPPLVEGAAECEPAAGRRSNAVSSAVAASGTAVASQSFDGAVAKASWVPPPLPMPPQLLLP